MSIPDEVLIGDVESILSANLQEMEHVIYQLKHLRTLLVKIRENMNMDEDNFSKLRKMDLDIRQVESYLDLKAMLQHMYDVGDLIDNVRSSFLQVLHDVKTS